MALTWTLKLNDAFSGPIKGAAKGAAAFKGEAKTAASSADALAKALGKVREAREKDARLGKLLAGPSKSKLMAPDKVTMKDRLASTMNAARAAADKYGPSFGSAKSALGGFAVAAGAATLASAALVGGLAIKGVGIVRDAQKFRESTLFAFEKILGSKSAADAAFKSASATALAVGAPLEETVGQIQTLMGRGFKADFADTLVRSMNDLKKVNPRANLDSVVTGIAQIQGKGKLMKEELSGQLGESMNIGNVQDIIGKKMGLKTRAAVDAAITAGKVDAKTGIDAIMEEINRSAGGGKAGTTAQQAADRTVEGAIQRAKTMASLKLGEIKTDYSPAISGIKRMTDAFNSPAGAKFMTAIEGGIQKIVNLADKFTAKDMSDGLDMATGVITKMTDGVVGAVNAVFKLKGAFDGAFGSGASMSAVGSIMGAIVAPIAMATAAVNALASAFSAVTGAAQSAGNAAQGVGISKAGLGGAGKGMMGGGIIGAGIGYLAGRASGGPVSAGTGYMVGENGPEYFQPRQSGTIVPNDELGRMSRAGESIGRSVTNSSTSKSLTVNATMSGDASNPNAGAVFGAQIADSLRHLVAGYA